MPEASEGAALFLREGIRVGTDEQAAEGAAGADLTLDVPFAAEVEAVEGDRVVFVQGVRLDDGADEGMRIHAVHQGAENAEDDACVDAPQQKLEGTVVYVDVKILKVVDFV